MFSLVVLAALAAAQNVYEAGVAIVDITATQDQLRGGECWLGGYGVWYARGRPEGVHDISWARAWVVADGNTTLAFATLDWTGLSNRMLRSMEAEVEAATGIPAENIHISATHTHSGPDGQGLWGGISAAYNRTVIDGTVKAIVEAFLGRQPVQIFVAQGNNTINNSNRRGHGYTDANEGTLDFISTQTGQRLFTVINYAAHPVTLGSSNKLVSGDWCHFTRERMEADLGVPVVFVNGAIGDVSPSGGSGSQFDRAQSTGYSVGEFALQLLQQPQTLVTGPLYNVRKNFRHPVSNPAFIAADVIGWLDYNWIKDPDAGYLVDTQTAYWRIGQVEGVSFPGESLTRNALPIKDAMSSQFRFFFGLTTDTLGYFVPTDEWNYASGYEEKVSIHKEVGDFTRDLLIETIAAAPAL